MTAISASIYCAMMRHVRGHRTSIGLSGGRSKAENMKRKPTQRQLWALALALLALLPLLAVLQYHWLGQVSEGERERKKSVLTTMARQFCHDFDSELTAIYLLLSADPHSLRRQTRSVSGRFRREIPALARNGGASEADQRGLSNATRGERRTPFAIQRRNRRISSHASGPTACRICGKDWKRRRARDESLQDQLHESIGLKKNVRGEVGAEKMVFQFRLNCVDEELPGLVISDQRSGQGAERRSPEEEVMPILGARSYRIIALRRRLHQPGADSRTGRHDISATAAESTR